MKGIIKFLKICLLLVLSLIVFVGIIVVYAFIQENLLIEKGFDIWFVNGKYIYLLFAIEVIVMLTVVRIFKGFISKGPIWNDDIIRLIEFIILKYKKITIIIVLIMGYLLFINVSYIKGDNITVRNTFNLSGKIYNISEIVKVQTGFEEGGFLKFWKEEGLFYYKVHFSDGRTLNLNPNTLGGDGENYKDKDTYLILEDLDNKIMKNKNIQKESSLNNIEANGLADQYVERFKRIINNK